jgi:hypothetical protein
MAKPVTRAELRKELAKYATKQDLEAWGHALYDKIDRAVAHVAKVIEESTRQLFIAYDDKYKDLPERVAKLEARND